VIARHRSGRLRRAGAVLAAGCSGSLGDPGLGDPTPPPSTAASPSGRVDPAREESLARFYGQHLEWTACGGAFQCSKLTVPVDWGRPDGDVLQIAVLRKRATGSRIGSLLLNPGGPGVGGASWVKAAADTFGRPLQSAYDLVGWDPRGTGGSAPVRCLDDKALDELYATDATPDDEREVQELVQESTDFARACAERSGASFAHLDTISNAKDMDVLRAALGDAVLNYYGASYGTYYGAWYAQLFPWRVGRLVLDGAVDPSLSSAQYSQGQAMGFARAVRSYVKDCLAKDGCPLRGTVDDAYAQLRSLLERADESPLRSASGRELTQAQMATGLARGLYASTFWPTISRGIAQAMRGDGTTLLALSDDYVERGPDGHYGQSLISYNPIYCLDHPETRSVDEIAAQARELGKEYPPLGDFIGWGALSCKVWPLPGVVPTQKLTASGAAPILVVGTTDDPATPYEWARSLASQLSSGRLLTRTGQGHVGYRQGNACIDRAVERYLVQGTLPAEGTVCS
jgi:pimeloyl-ACP methyl ester carboxylesterase